MTTDLGTDMKFLFAVLLFLFAAPAIHAQTVLTVNTEPNAIVWVDEIRRGKTDDAGKLVLNKVSPGRHSVRVRANGFKESMSTTQIVGRRTLAIKLVPNPDQAELLFQQAETAREKARDDGALQKAAELYREAIKLRPFSAAHVGLARVLLDLSELKEAHQAIDAARRLRPNYAEASAVEGRIFREEAFGDDAIRSYRRAIREGAGVQPEAFVGIAKVYEDKGDYAAAIVEYRKALTQLSESEPVIYQMVGAAYERVEKPKEAVAAYEKYLQLAPNGSYAAAIRSILEQLKREAAGEQIIP